MIAAKALVFVFAFVFYIPMPALAQLTRAGGWSRTAANNIEVLPNITYLRTGNAELKLDIYRSYNKKLKRPTLIWIHGGGWTRSSKEAESLYILPYLEAGWTVANVEYRLAAADMAPAAVEDCRCALRWIAANAKTYEIGLDHLVVSGISAGGHLALTTLLPERSMPNLQCAGADPKIAAVINWFGPSDIVDLLAGPNAFDQALEWFGNRSDRLEIARRISPINSVVCGFPPILTIHGDRDKIIPYAQSVRFHKALDKQHVSNKLVTFRGRGHGDFDNKQFLRAYAEIDRFLQKNGIR